MKIIRSDEVPDEVRGSGSYVIKRLITDKLEHNPDNIGFYRTTIPKGSKVQNHSHSHLDEIFIFITEARAKIEGKEYAFRPLDIVFLRAGEKHEIYADDKEVILIAVKAPDLKEDKVVYDEQEI